MTETELHAIFMARVKAAGGQRALSRELGITPSYAHDLVARTRPMSDRIAALLGYFRNPNQWVSSTDDESVLCVKCVTQIFASR